MNVPFSSSDRKSQQPSCTQSSTSDSRLTDGGEKKIQVEMWAHEREDKPGLCSDDACKLN